MSAAIVEMKNFCEKQGDGCRWCGSKRLIFGTPVAQALELPSSPFEGRKAPRETVSCSYQLEYGEATIELHKEDVTPADRVVIIDDSRDRRNTAGFSFTVPGGWRHCSRLLSGDQPDDLGGRSAIENSGLELHSILTY